MKTLSLMCISVLVGFTSCSKNEMNDASVKSLNSIQYMTGSNSQQLADFFSAEASGNFLISSDLGATEPFDGSLTFFAQGGIIDDNSTQVLGFGDFRVGDVIVDSENNGYGMVFNANYVGQNVNISLNNIANTSEEFSVDLYFPVPMTDQDVFVPEEITVGSTITWNADPNNDKGVLIMIQYNMDELFVEIGDEKQIYVSDDNGSYTFKTEDFQGMNNNNSNNNSCLISIIRGDYAMVFNSSNPSLNSRVVYTFSSPMFVCHSN